MIPYLPPELVMNAIRTLFSDISEDDRIQIFKEFTLVADEIRNAAEESDEEVPEYLQWESDFENVPEDVPMLIELPSGMVTVGYCNGKSFFTREGVLINSTVSKYLIF